MRTSPAAIALLLLLLSAVFVPSGAQAGAWVPAPGDGYVKLWTKWLHGFGYHDGDDRTIDYGGYEEVYLATYGEYGVLPGLALTWNMDLVRAAFLEDPRDGDQQSHATIGDPRVGLRLKLVQSGRLAVGLDVTGLAPLASDDALQPFVYADGTQAGQLRLGAGVFEASAAVSAGLGFDGFYTQASFGYLLRSDGFDDVVQFTAEGGGNLSSDWAARLRVTGHLALEGDDAPYLENPSGIGNGVSYVGFALESDYRVSPGWFVGATVEGGVVAIRRQTGGPVFTVYGAHSF